MVGRDIYLHVVVRSTEYRSSMRGGRSRLSSGWLLVLHMLQPGVSDYPIQRTLKV